jgi:phosphate transport system permease protein
MSLENIENNMIDSSNNTSLNQASAQPHVSVTMSVTDKVSLSLQKRHRKEKRFKSIGLFSVVFGFMLVALLLSDITYKALPAFHQHWVKLDINYSSKALGVLHGDINKLTPSVELENQLMKASYRKLLRNSIYQTLSSNKAQKLNRQEKRQLYKLFSTNAEFTLKDHLLDNLTLYNQSTSVWVRLDDDVDSYLKESFTLGTAGLRINDKQAQWIKQLSDNNQIESRFNISFFTSSDSREPELAGIKGALMGTLLTLFVTLLLSFPLGVAGAIYLEEFAPKNRLTDIIEININNLAAVPSIVFGLLGLAIIINLFGLPRSAPLVGGIVLTLMTLPTIIIASRAAIKAVPPSIREAAIGLGASKMQVTFSHVLPQAMPGIITGAIIGIAQALGETAPLLMIGMVAFIVDVTTSIVDSATVLPVLIFLWADSPERAFLAKTSAAILVLLTLLLIINLTATVIRNKFENK